MITPRGGWDIPPVLCEPESEPVTPEVAGEAGNRPANKSRIVRHISIVLSLLCFLTFCVANHGVIASQPFMLLLSLLSWFIFWGVRYGLLRVLIIIGSVISFLSVLIIAGLAGQKILEFLLLAILVGVAIWVRQDAIKRGMGPQWGTGVLLAAIIVVPLYFLKRRPLPFLSKEIKSRNLST